MEKSAFWGGVGLTHPLSPPLNKKKQVQETAAAILGSVASTTSTPPGPGPGQGQQGQHKEKEAAAQRRATALTHTLNSAALLPPALQQASPPLGLLRFLSLVELAVDTFEYPFRGNAAGANVRDAVGGNEGGSSSIHHALAVLVPGELGRGWVAGGRDEFI